MAVASGGAVPLKNFEKGGTLRSFFLSSANSDRPLWRSYLLDYEFFATSLYTGILSRDSEPSEGVVPAGGLPADHLWHGRGDGLALHVHGHGVRGQAVRRASTPLCRRKTSGDPGREQIGIPVVTICNLLSQVHFALASYYLGPEPRSKSSPDPDGVDGHGRVHPRLRGLLRPLLPSDVRRHRPGRHEESQGVSAEVSPRRSARSGGPNGDDGGRLHGGGGLPKRWLIQPFHDVILVSNNNCSLGLGAVHGLSEPIGAVFDTQHGLTNAVLLPYVILANSVRCPNHMEKRYLYVENMHNGVSNLGFHFFFTRCMMVVEALGLRGSGTVSKSEDGKFTMHWCHYSLALNISFIM